jgi:quercetin dioxygenase-like cupin family protein
MATERKTAAKVFTFLNDEILAGTGDISLPGAEGLTGVIKRYETGGENVMHTHPTEDHTFYILEGQATFHIEKEENVVVADKYDGVFFPRGAFYWFHSSGDTKLIILRTGNELGSDRLIGGRIVPSARTGPNAVRVAAKDLPF